MKLRKIIGKLAGLLAMAAVLGLSTPVLSAEYDTWAGPFNFKVTTTKQNPDGKLVKTTNYATGTVEMYIVPNAGPTQDSEGYFVRFIDPTEGLKVGIKGLKIISTNIPNSKCAKIVGVGVGQFFEADIPVGPAYMSLKGKVALDDFGNPISISASLTMEGGSPGSDPNDGEYIWSGKPKVVLTKQVDN